jgi:hypothetical protein
MLDELRRLQVVERLARERRRQGELRRDLAPGLLRRAEQVPQDEEVDPGGVDPQLVPGARFAGVEAGGVGGGRAFGPATSPDTAAAAIKPPTMMTLEIALVTAISGVCRAGVTDQTT